MLHWLHRVQLNAAIVGVNVQREVDLAYTLFVVDDKPLNTAEGQGFRRFDAFCIKPKWKWKNTNHQAGLYTTHDQEPPLLPVVTWRENCEYVKKKNHQASERTTFEFWTKRAILVRHNGCSYGNPKNFGRIRRIAKIYSSKII